MELVVALMPIIWHRCGSEAATQSPVLACYVMNYLAAFFGRVIPSAVKEWFGKLSCKLCQKERVALLWHSWMDESNMLNDRSELHGSCRHTDRFHQLTMRSGTDDSE
jgi:hypothetical protein